MGFMDTIGFGWGGNLNKQPTNTKPSGSPSGSGIDVSWLPPNVGQLYKNLLLADPSGELAPAYLGNFLFGDGSGGSSSSGGGGSGSSFQMGADPAGSFNATMGFNRNQAVAALAQAMMQAEYERLGAQASGGSELIGQFSDALGWASPDSQKSAIGYEPGGLAEKWAKMTGTSTDFIGPFQDAQKATLPFQQIADILNSLPTPEQAMDRFRPLAEQLMPPIAPIGNMTTGGSSQVSGGLSQAAYDAMFGGETGSGNPTGIQGPPKPVASSASKGPTATPIQHTASSYTGYKPPTGVDNTSLTALKSYFTPSTIKYWKSQIPSFNKLATSGLISLRNHINSIKTPSQSIAYTGALNYINNLLKQRGAIK